MKHPDVLGKKDVYSLLKRKIMNGELKPNEQLKEMNLAKTLGCDEAEVRKAFKKLDEIGFVKLVPFTGTFVTSVSDTEIRELFEYRSLIELNALTRFIPNLVSSDIEVLSDTIDLMRLAAAENDFVNLLEYDMYFHLYIVKRSKSALTLKLWYQIDPHMKRFISNAYQHRFNYPIEVAETHVPLIEALKQGDIQRAKEEFSQHVTINYYL